MQLLPESCEILEQAYARIREEIYEDRSNRTQPATPRLVETMIRLAEACARSRMSKQVEVQDAKLAVRFVRFSLFNEESGGEIGGSLNPGQGGSDTQELETIMNAEPEGFISAERITACTNELTR